MQLCCKQNLRLTRAFLPMSSAVPGTAIGLAPHMEPNLDPNDPRNRRNPPVDPNHPRPPQDPPTVTEQLSSPPFRLTSKGIQISPCACVRVCCVSKPVQEISKNPLPDSKS